MWRFRLGFLTPTRTMASSHQHLKVQILTRGRGASGREGAVGYGRTRVRCRDGTALTKLTVYEPGGLTIGGTNLWPVNNRKTFPLSIQ
jgi:hypothetical protein